MTQTVTDANGTVHHFPDEATPDMIAGALGVSPPEVSKAALDSWRKKNVEWDTNTAIANIPDSAYRYGSDVLTGMASMSPFGEQKDGGVGFRVPPIGEQLAPIVSGAAQHITGLADNPNRPTQEQMGGSLPSADMASMVGDYYKGRYGSWDNIKQTGMDDPIGALSDLSVPLTLGATGGAKLAQMVGGRGSALAQGLQTTARATNALDPLGALSEGARLAYRPMVGAVTGQMTDDMARASDKAFDAGITMNRSGLNRLDNLASQKMNARDDILRGIDETFDVSNEVMPSRRFVDDMMAPDSSSRLGSTVPDAGKRIGKVSADVLADALRGGDTRDALGLNRIKSKEMQAANAMRAYSPDANVGIDAGTHKAIGSQLRGRLETAAGPQGDRLRGLNEDYGDLAGIREGLADTVGAPAKFGVDYPTRSALSALGAGPKSAVAAGFLTKHAADYGTILAQALRRLGRKDVRTMLIQSGRSQQEADRIIQEAEEQ